MTDPAESNKVALQHLAAQVKQGILSLTPGGREQALALTNIEQGFMWATKSLYVQPVVTSTAQ